MDHLDLWEFAAGPGNVPGAILGIAGSGDEAQRTLVFAIALDAARSGLRVLFSSSLPLALVGGMLTTVAHDRGGADDLDEVVITGPVDEGMVAGVRADVVIIDHAYYEESLPTVPHDVLSIVAVGVHTTSIARGALTLEDVDVDPRLHRRFDRIVGLGSPGQARGISGEASRAYADALQLTVLRGKTSPSARPRPGGFIRSPSGRSSCSSRSRRRGGRHWPLPFTPHASSPRRCLEPRPADRYDVVVSPTIVHEQVLVTAPDGTRLHVDAGMAALLSRLWRGSVRTRWSCEGEPGRIPGDGSAYLIVDGERDLRRFLAGVARTNLVVDPLVELPLDHPASAALPGGSTWIVVRGFGDDGGGVGVYFTHADGLTLARQWESGSWWRRAIAQLLRH